MSLTIERNTDKTPKAAFKVFWGGPDQPSRFLRDVLEERIHAVPSGGEILWATYYFRDEGLANALTQASCRGVRVRIAIDGNPRTGAVNNRVRKLLKNDNALGGGLRTINHRIVDNRYFRSCRLHEKLYYFSHPCPTALVGTFNPSGNHPEDPVIIKKIGDQDRGHNLLVEFHDSILVQGLYAHANRVFQMIHGPWERFLPQNNKIVSSGKTRILFFPRSRNVDFSGLFDGLETGSRLRIAVSHINDRGICRRLLMLARKGVHIEIIAHDTQRRVPAWVEKMMLQGGITFLRYVHPDGLPMHNKFMLIDTPKQQLLTFGSMNLSVRSLHANHELLVITEDTSLFQEMEKRWYEILNEIKLWA